MADFNSVRKLQLFLLDNYLEIDIGYYTLETLYARREYFKVIFDKTNLVESKMLNSWNELKDKNKGTTEAVDMSKIVKSADDDLWYNVMHSVIAFKRGDKYRCYFEVNEIRDKVIDLIAKRNNLESKRYRQINLLSVEDKDKIKKMFTYPQTYEELSELLLEMLKYIFEEFEYWDNRARIKFYSDKDFLERFVLDNCCN